MKNFFSLRSMFVAATSALLIAGSAAMAQTPSFVQVPYASVSAGVITSTGTNSSSTPSASCTNGLKTTQGNSYGDGCPATQAAVDEPWGTATDSWGNVYFGDQGHDYLRVIYGGATTVNGVVNPATAMILAANVTQTTLTTLVAGDVYALGGGLTAVLPEVGSSYYCNGGSTGTVALTTNGSGCPATQSYVKGAYGAAVDSAGNVFVLDKSNSLVYVVLANANSLAAQMVTLENPTVTAPQVGYIYQVVGKGGGYVDGVLANNAGEIHAPSAIAVDANDSLYIGDVTNFAVRMVNGPLVTNSVAPGFIHTIAGTCTSSCTGQSGLAASGTPALGAAFYAPSGIAVDSSLNVYISDAGESGVPSTVRVIYAGGTNNPAASLICLETSVCSTSLVAGDVYTIAGGSTTASGNSATGNGAMATSSAVEFDKIQGIALDQYGNVYIADYGSHSVIAELNAATGNLAFLGGDGQSTFKLGYYCSTGAATGTGSIMTDSYGDSCPGPQSLTDHVEGNIAVSPSGNIYFADEGDNLVRELSYNSAGSSAGTFPATVATIPATAQKLAFMLLTGSSGEAASGVSVGLVAQGAVTTEFVNAVTGDTCTGSTTLTGASTASTGITAGTISACEVPIIFTPAAVGVRTGALELTATINSVTQIYGTAYLNGIGQGAAVALDPATATTIGTGEGAGGVAVDASGNVYTSYISGAGTLTSTSGALATTPGSGLANPRQVAVDGAGNVFVAEAGSNRIDEFAAGASTYTIVASAGLADPLGVALDASGNMYIADTGNARVVEQPNGNGNQLVLGSGFTTPVSVAVDASGNVYVADTGLQAIVKIAAGTGVQTTVLGSINPTAIAVDAAGDIYYADSTAKDVVEIPVSGASSVIVSGLGIPNGLALDSNGGLYVADSANTGVSYYNRTSSTQAFTPSVTLISANFTNIGNENYTETGSAFTQTDSTDFSVAAATANGCNFLSPLAAGTNCGISALFTPGTTGALSDTATFSGNAFNTGSVTLNLSGTSGAVTTTTTTTLGAVSPATPTYGQSVRITVTVVPSSGSSKPTGNVTFTVDSVPQTPVALVNGAYTLPLSSLSAGLHTIAATYAGAGSYSGSSTTAATSFTVAQLAITATATNPAPTAVYGQAIPTITGTLTGVLPADTTTVSPVFAVTAVQGSPVTSYPVSVSLMGSAAANYTVTLTAPASLSITKATITLAVSAATKVYGAALPTFTGTPTGVLPADQNNVSGVYTTTATAASVVTTLGYPITAASLTGSAAGNYTLGTVTPGVLTITPAALTTTATPVSVAVGATIPTITGTALAGVLPADSTSVSAVFSTTATSSSPIGTYPISVALTGSAAPNYTVSLTTPAVVTIKAGAVSIVVNNATSQYGAALPTFSGVLTGVQPGDLNNVGANYSTTATSTSAPGPFSITATALTGSAAANYSLGTVTPGTLTITKANTTVGLTASVATVDEGSSVTFTATVASTTTGTPTGSVTFYEGTTPIGTGTLSAGVAFVNFAGLNFGTQSITATYTTTTDYAASTSSVLSESVVIPVVAPTLSSSSLSISSSGGSGTVTLNLVAEGGYTGTATFSCANLPADMTCSFVPPTATFTSTASTASTVLTVSTKGTTTAMLHTPVLPGSHHNLPLLAVCFPGVLLGFLGLRNRKHRQGRQGLQRLMMFAILLGGLAGIAGLTGCSSGGAASNTPAGTYNVTVQVTAGTVQTIPLTVTVQ